MEAKLLEIRDKATFMPALAIKISDNDGYLARRSGYGSPLVLLHFLRYDKAHYDPFYWNDRTRQTAHLHIQARFDELKHDDVIDVEFILGETKEPKKSERFDEVF